jgi:hypothetical protein
VTHDLIAGSSKLVVACDVRAATETFISERGERRYEAVVFWFATIDDVGDAQVQSAYVPDQTPLSTDDGIGVYIDGDAITRAILALANDEIIAARVHSHPNLAYHSVTDDLNRLISHDGAISIVVPYFGRYGLNPRLCSVNEFRLGRGWQELPVDDVRERIMFP